MTSGNGAYLDFQKKKPQRSSVKEQRAPLAKKTAKEEIRPVPKRAASTFADILWPFVPPSGKPLAKAVQLSAPLAHLAYIAERQVKELALQAFWKFHGLAGVPGSIIGSPQPRGYRTTTKRRVVVTGGAVKLLFGDKQSVPQKQVFLPSPIEPREHANIYRFLQGKLSEPAFLQCAEHINYLIIRGNYRDRAVIFNVDTLNGPLVRKLKILASYLESPPVSAMAAYVYPDPSRSAYYFENRRPEDLLHFKKLFGPNSLTVTHSGCRYQFHPTSFSQVNESMVPVMLKLARELLKPDKRKTLLDLYCGYGLFSHFFAADYRQVLGIDAEGPAIRSAQDNCRINKGQGTSVTFRAHTITGEYIENDLPQSVPGETVLLDPPKQGPQSGVIKAISERRPTDVLHIFCGVDTIPQALSEWQKCGYQVDSIISLDMFPGTANLEIMILLHPHSV